MEEKEPPIARVLPDILEWFARARYDNPEFLERLRRVHIARVARREVFHDLSDEEWEQVRGLLPEADKAPRSGRPAQSQRQVLNGVLWYVTHPDSSWKDLPEDYPSHQTCFRYYVKWRSVGVLKQIQQALKFGETQEF